MKRKRLMILLLPILAGMCVFASCQEQPSPTEPPVHEHAYGAWSETKAPTCAEKGLQTRSCACGATDTKEIEATGEHDYDEGQCTVCGAQDPNSTTPQEPPAGDDLTVEGSNPQLPGDSVRY